MNAFYLITTVYPRQGFGSGGDATPDKDEAYDQYVEAITDNGNATVWLITPDEERARDVTSDFQDMHADICEARDLIQWVAE